MLFFVAKDDVNGEELWRSDGTPTGTVMVKNIAQGNLWSSPSRLSNINNQLIFAANDDVHGNELWVSDGTFTGTTLLKNINHDVGSYPTRLFNYNNI